MNLQDCEKYLASLFDEEKLRLYPNEYGFNTKGKSEIKRLGYATNLTLEVVQDAVKQKVDMLVTHHDAWDFLHGMKEECVRMLNENAITHYFSHLLLDDAEFGTNASLMDKLEANIIKKTNLDEECFYCGRVAEFEQPVDFNDLVKKAENILEEPVKYWVNHDRKIKRICFVAGAGDRTSDLQEAIDNNCDVYITGEKTLFTLLYSKYKKINLIIGSHTFTEIFGVESLVNKIKERFNDIEIIRIKEEHIE